MLSLNDCKNILNDGDEFYSDEEIILIRDWLTHMADIAIESMEKNKLAKE